MSKKKTIIAVWAVVFCVLLGNYLLNPNRMDTKKVLLNKGAQTGKDYMLSSLNVTSFALDKRELMWIGTSAGINVYDGKDYIQFIMTLTTLRRCPTTISTCCISTGKDRCGWARRTA